MRPREYLRTDVDISFGPTSHLAADFHVYPQACEKQFMLRRWWALSEMVGHVALLKEFYSPFVNISLATAGMEACESLFTHL